MSDWDIGDQVTISVSVYNAAGTLADPTTVTLTVRKPDGTLTTPLVTKNSTGVYHADVFPDINGTWYYRWVGGGSMVVAEEGLFAVRERRVA